jgi:chemotaxis protein MotB
MARRKEAHGGGHGWFVTFADLMGLLVSFFVMLVAFSNQDAKQASLRQALQDMPELTEASKHIMVEETKEGLNIDIVDQDGRSMFANGSKEPYERTRQLIQKIAGPLKAVPYRISITGHTSGSQGSPKPDYGPWNLSADRANTVRQILEEEGYPSANIYKVAGKANTDPLFPDDPDIAANRRVTITLIREAPPMPPDLQP